MRLLEVDTNILLCKGFSQPSTTPSMQRMPIAVPLFSTALPAYCKGKNEEEGSSGRQPARDSDEHEQDKNE